MENQAIGVRAAQALLARIERRMPQERIVVVGFTLIGREST